MKPSIKANFTAADVSRLLQKRKQAYEAAIISRLKFIGEKFITNSRNNGTYKDQTGNLRSSIGYLITKNGNVIFESFPGLRSEAVERAKRVAREVASRLGNTGFAIIGVAGMEYAAAVESKGFDVITNSANQAKTDMQNALKGFRIV